MKFPLALAAFAAALGSSAPASATVFEFFEGNDCTQSKLGSVDTAVHEKRLLPFWNISLKKNWVVPQEFVPFVIWGSGWNDEARSVRVFSNWRHTPDYRFAQLTVYDSPSGSKDDDWVRVIVDDVQAVPEEGVCVGSFENNFARDGVRLERHPKNGIDGKISLLETMCDFNCKADKVGPEARTPPPKLIVKKPAPGKLKLPSTVRIIKRTGQ